MLRMNIPNGFIWSNENAYNPPLCISFQDQTPTISYCVHKSTERIKLKCLTRCTTFDYNLSRRHNVISIKCWMHSVSRTERISRTVARWCVSSFYFMLLWSIADNKIFLHQFAYDSIQSTTVATAAYLSNWWYWDAIIYTTDTLDLSRTMTKHIIRLCTFCNSILTDDG